MTIRSFSKMTRPIVVAGIAAFSTIGLHAQGSWTLAKKSDGIEVYTRNVPNSQLREFRGEVEFPGTVQQVVDVLRDANAFRTWMPDVVTSRLIKVSGDDQYHFLENAAPWPVSNRDGAYHFSYSPATDGSASMVVRVEAVPDLVPEQPGKVRVRKSDGAWRILAKVSTVKVSYQIHADPGGSIPTWMANATVVDTPFKTLKALRETIQARQKK